MTSKEGPKLRRGRLGGATGATTGASAASATMSMKTMRGVYCIGTYDRSSSTGWVQHPNPTPDMLPVGQYLEMGQNHMVDQILGFERKGMMLFKQYLFNTSMQLLHDFLAVDQVERLVYKGNYVPSGATALYYAVHNAISENEKLVAPQIASGYKWQRVYWFFTDFDGDNSSESIHHITPAKTKAVVQAALDTKQVTVF